MKASGRAGYAGTAVKMRFTLARRGQAKNSNVFGVWDAEQEIFILARVQPVFGSAIYFSQCSSHHRRCHIVQQCPCFRRQISAPSNVLIRGNIVERISREPIAVDRSAETRIIDGGGRTLMPGLSDMHWHAMLVRPTPAIVLGSDIGYTTLLAGAEATATLMRGFTTVRDMGGPSFSLKRAIDEGVLPGPRIYPSGAMISVTSGHGDFRQPTDLPRTIGGMLSRMEQLGGSMIADSPDEVRIRVREQLMQGASQIKLTAGGGVASPFSPLDVSTFTEAELRAAVEAAENWGTYVAAH
jgi:imidazolonepropionase-like amidohydrolase